MSPTLHIRNATPDDAALVHELIVALAVYEREPDAVEATPESLRRDIESASPPFECVIAEVDGAPIGFALYFQSYSTWKGRPGMYLEDLFVLPEHRGQGAGRALLVHLARVCEARGYARLEWSVLNWNEPALRFYASIGASPMREWTVQRLTGDALSRLARS